MLTCPFWSSKSLLIKVAFCASVQWLQTNPSRRCFKTTNSRAKLAKWEIKVQKNWWNKKRSQSMNWVIEMHKKPNKIEIIFLNFIRLVTSPFFRAVVCSSHSTAFIISNGLLYTFGLVGGCNLYLQLVICIISYEHNHFFFSHSSSLCFVCISFILS